MLFRSITEDILLLSVVWQRLRQDRDLAVRNGNIQGPVTIPSSPTSITDGVLFNNITSSDRTKAEKIRDYYSKKIVWWTLNDIRLSNFRQDLKKLIQSDGKVFQENMKALAYRMPEFYDYDTVFDEMFLNYNATIQQSKHQDFVTKKLKLVKTFIRKRRPSTYKEYRSEEHTSELQSH